MRRRSCSGSRITSTSCAGWTIMKSGANRKEHRNKNARGKSRHPFGLCRMNRPLCCLLASHAPCIAPHFNDLRSIQPVKQASARSFCRASRVSQPTGACLCAWQKRDKKWPVSKLIRPKIYLSYCKIGHSGLRGHSLLRAGYQKSRFTFSEIRHAPQNRGR